MRTSLAREKVLRDQLIKQRDELKPERFNIHSPRASTQDSPRFVFGAEGDGPRKPPRVQVVGAVQSAAKTITQTATTSAAVAAGSQAAGGESIPPNRPHRAKPLTPRGRKKQPSDDGDGDEGDPNRGRKPIRDHHKSKKHKNKFPSDDDDDDDDDDSSDSDNPDPGVIHRMLTWPDS